MQWTEILRKHKEVCKRRIQIEAREWKEKQDAGGRKKWTWEERNTGRIQKKEWRT